MRRRFFLLPLLLALLWPGVARMGEPRSPEWLPLRLEEVRQGDTLESLSRRLGLPGELVPALAEAYGRFASQRGLQPGEPVALTRQQVTGRLRLDCHPGLVRRLSITLPLVQRGDSLALLPGAGLQATLDSLPAVRSRRVVRGRVAGNLYDSVLGAGGSASSVMAYADIFQSDLDFLLDTREGDGFWLVQEVARYGGQWLADSLTEEGPILAARYEGAEERAAAARFEGCGVSGYFDAEGKSLRKQFLKSPLSFRRISSYFGLRGHPVLRRVRLHEGIDYAAPAGTPVSAAADGVVASARWERGYGRVIRLRHDRRRVTVYGHLSRFAAGLRAGHHVEQSELIGFVGATGLATGPHLHYEFIQDGRSLDPLRVVNPPSHPIPAACLPGFQALFRRWHAEEGVAFK